MSSARILNNLAHGGTTLGEAAARLLSSEARSALYEKGASAVKAGKRELVQGSIDMSDIIEFSKKMSDEKVKKRLTELLSSLP